MPVMSPRRSPSTACSATKTLAREYGPQGVTVNAISPGAIDTYRGNDATRLARLATATKDIPLRRLGTSEEIAGGLRPAVFGRRRLRHRPDDRRQRRRRDVRGLPQGCRSFPGCCAVQTAVLCSWTGFLRGARNPFGNALLIRGRRTFIGHVRVLRSSTSCPQRARDTRPSRQTTPGTAASHRQAARRRRR